MYDGIIFGFVDNAVLILGAYTGWEVEKYLPAKLQVGVGAIAGAGIGNSISDGLAALLDPAMLHMTGGIVIGCLIPLAGVPLIAKRTRKTQ